jgi:hypothetical protein
VTVLFYGCSDAKTKHLVQYTSDNGAKVVVIGHKDFQPKAKGDFVDINEIDYQFSNIDTCSTIKISDHSEEFTLFCHALDRKSFYGHLEALAEHLFKKMLSYAVKFIKEKSVKKVIFDNIPHQIDSIIFAVACKELGVPYMSRGVTPFKDVHVWYGDIINIETLYDDSCFCNKSFNKMIESVFLMNKVDELWYMKSQKRVSVRSKINLFFISYAHKYSLFFFFLLKNKKKKNRASKFYIPNSSNKVKSIFDYIDIEKIKSKHLKNLKLEHDKVVDVFTEEDLPDKYIYFPLHFQPEATTMPLGGRYRDQLSLIFHLSEKIDSDTFLLIKEHPTTFIAKNRGDRGRWTGFYENFIAFDNVKLVATDFNSKILIQNACSVATITGTVSLEAAALNKHVHIYGYPWYKSLFNKSTKSNSSLDWYYFDASNKIMIFDLSLKEGLKMSLKFVTKFIK